jgi:hypothetical protein
MPKRKRNLSVELVRRRQDLELSDLADEITKLRIPLSKAVAAMPNYNKYIVITATMSKWSILGLGLFEIFAKLRIYRHLDNENPVHARCFVRTEW